MRPSDASAHGTISHEAGSWRGFTAAFGIAAGITLAVLYGIVLGLDPYGRRAGPERPPSPIMDVNQRYMYPQVARSGRYDAAVFGTSTVRLLDPRALGTALGGRFANLALNAGTPWEQLELAKLFLRHVTAPSGIVLGLDRPWCDPTADTPAQRLTFRSFPPWLYDERSLGDLPHLLNMKSLEIAIRVALHRAGLMRERIRGDGYEVFTPPEASYDLARVRLQLYADPGPASTEPAGFESEPRRPALAWLAAFASSLPATTRLVLLFPPLHVSGQPAAAGSRRRRELQAGRGPGGRGAWCDHRRLPAPDRAHARGLELLGPAALPPPDRGPDRRRSRGRDRDGSRRRRRELWRGRRAAVVRAERPGEGYG